MAKARGGKREGAGRKPLYKGGSVRIFVPIALLSVIRALIADYKESNPY